MNSGLSLLITTHLRKLVCYKELKRPLTLYQAQFTSVHWVGNFSECGKHETTRVKSMILFIPGSKYPLPLQTSMHFF